MTEPRSTERLMGQMLPAALRVDEVGLDELDAEGGLLGTHGPFEPPVRIGGATGNDLCLDDATVSRHHCILVRTSEGLAVRDAGSSNGTYVGSVRVGEAWLAEGDRLRLGATTLRVRVTRSRPIDLSYDERFGDLVGRSCEMRALFAMLARLAPTAAPVLIQGETGTGKELVARAIHASSDRRGEPFVVVDCGALAPTLVESELFGHARGAFTGAQEARRGAFAEAEGGTPPGLVRPTARRLLHMTDYVNLARTCA